jgi:glucose-1-phosphatase
MEGRMIDCEAIVFDVDGVLARGTDSWSSALEAAGITEDEFFRGWGASTAAKDFESGASHERAFAEARSRELGSRIEPRALLELLRARKSALIPGVEGLLRDLAEQGYRLACLSNTNPVHWGSIEGREALERYLERRFLSHETGLVKPAPEAFSRAFEALGCDPGGVVYFDDAARNVAAAAGLGARAFLVDGFRGMVDDLRSLGAELGP